MIKKVFSLVLFIFFIFINNLQAHNPTDIAIDPDFNNEILNLNIAHPVSKPNKHYIRRVDAQVDEQEMIVKFFFFQLNDDYANLKMPVPGIKEGKKLKIIAYSTNGGSFEKDFDLKKIREGKAS